MFGFRRPAPEARSFPMHARAPRLAQMRYYRRKRMKEELRRARRVISMAKANRIRIIALLGSIVLLFVELGFVLGVVATRWRG